MNNYSKQVIYSNVHGLKNLPALPEASIRILAAINDPEISIEKLAEALSTSPGLVARLLGLANSAYFGQAGKINDVQAAIFQVLGVELVKSLALGIVMNVQFDASKCQHFDTEYFWMRSMLTAAAGQKLAILNEFRAYPSSTVYNCGLLLYIGVLVLAFLVPDQLNLVLLRCKQNQSLRLGDEIVRQLELSHYQLGYELLQKWHLSPVFQALLHHYEAENLTGDEEQLTNLLHASQKISSMVLANKAVDPVELELIADRALLSADSVTMVFNDLLETKQDIQKLALIMGS